MAEHRPDLHSALDDLEGLIWEADKATGGQAAAYARQLEAYADAITAIAQDPASADEADDLVDDARRMARRLRRGGRHG